MKTVDVQHMIDHCSKLLEANQTAYVDPDALAMARFIIEQHIELGELTKALTEALALFDANWCTAHGHAPTPATFDRATALQKRLHPQFTRDRYP